MKGLTKLLMVVVVGVLIAGVGVRFIIGSGGGSTDETAVVQSTAGSTPTPNPTATATPIPTPTPEPGNTLVLAYDGWSGTYLPMYVLKAIFEDELGYFVRVADESTVPAAFESVASGGTDIFTSAWFPARDFTFGKYPNLVKLGQVYGGKEKDAYEGWMVSADLAKRYGLIHVGDLRDQEVVRALDTDGNGKGNLIGAPSDYVAAKLNPEILADYELGNLYEIDPVGSEEEFLNTVENRFRDGKPALFYMYQPVAFPGDLPIMDRAVWLEGTNTYLPLSFDRTIVRSDLIVNHPEVAKVLSEYRIPGADISRAMGEIAKNGDSPEALTKVARAWIDSHRAEVDSWLEGTGKRTSSPSPPSEVLSVAYSPEKEDLFLKLAIKFNLTRSPGVPPIHPIRVDMADMLRDAVAGKFDAISPDSSVWMGQLDRMWQQRNPGASPLVGATTRYAVSPIVIAMWKSRAAQLGLDSAAVSGQDLLKMVVADPTFKWSHTSPTTASGLLIITGQFYAGAGKLSNLTREDLEAETTLGYVKTVESTVARYGGESEDKVVIRMLAEGGQPLDAFVAQEQLVIYFNRNTEGEQLVALYPEEGTFWMDHPLVLMEGPWVTENQKRTFNEFARFVREQEQKRLVLEEGYRFEEGPVPPQEEGSLILPEYGADPTEPKTLLEIPPADILESIREVWRLLKKPANIYLVVDVSGSMAGKKMDDAKAALVSFIDQMQGDRDEVALVPFSSGVGDVEPLGLPDRSSLVNRIRGLKAGGGTELYEAVAFAYDELQREGDADRINVIVAMTDGRSGGEISTVESRIREEVLPVLIFTVGYGSDADFDVLRRIARLGNGQVFSSDPKNIEKLYQLLSAFF